MNRLEVQMCLIDQEINQLISRKNLIDIRLNELHEQREDLVIEWENQEGFIRRSDGRIEKITRKDSIEMQELYDEMFGEENGNI